VTAAETMRVWWAIALAPTVEVCDSLLRGERVDAEALDPLALHGAKQRGAVLLCEVVDLFDVREAA
jgi:hypothetical protein